VQELSVEVLNLGLVLFLCALVHCIFFFFKK